MIVRIGERDKGSVKTKCGEEGRRQGVRKARMSLLSFLSSSLSSYLPFTAVDISLETLENMCKRMISFWKKGKKKEEIRWNNEEEENASVLLLFCV